MRNVAIAILVPVIFGIACDDKPPASTAPPSNLRPVSVRIDGPTHLTQPAEVQFTAVQTWSDASTRDVTASAQWISSNPLVLSVNAGLANTLAGGEVGLTAQVDQLTSQPKSVRVMPSMPEWDGVYTLTVGGGNCIASSALPPESRRRTYIARVRQVSLNLNVTVANVGEFAGQIFNPQVRFDFAFYEAAGRRLQSASATAASPAIRPVSYRKFAYPSTMFSFLERLSDGNRLAVKGVAITTMSPSGFTGTLNGALSLYEPARWLLITECSSSSHEFTLVRN